MQLNSERDCVVVVSACILNLVAFKTSIRFVQTGELCVYVCASLHCPKYRNLITKYTYSKLKTRVEIANALARNTLKSQSQVTKRAGKCVETTVCVLAKALCGFVENYKFTSLVYAHGVEMARSELFDVYWRTLQTYRCTFPLS